MLEATEPSSEGRVSDLKILRQARFLKLSNNQELNGLSWRKIVFSRRDASWRMWEGHGTKKLSMETRGELVFNLFGVCNGY